MSKGSFKLSFVCVRTKMCGGGTSYDVYVPVKAKRYHPIVGHVYATVCVRDGRDYFAVDDFLRDATIDGLPSFSDERMNAFRRLVRVADRLAIRIARRAFPELASLPKLPMLWADWTLPSDEKRISVKISGRNYFRLCN